MEEPVAQGPEIFNTDQGVQFTALEFTSRLEAAEVRISMDGRGRALDNVFVERLWRSVKYEHVYLYEYVVVPELEKGLHNYFTFVTTQLTPAQDPKGLYSSKKCGCAFSTPVFVNSLSIEKDL